MVVIFCYEEAVGGLGCLGAFAILFAYCFWCYLLVCGWMCRVLCLGFSCFVVFLYVVGIFLCS